MANGGGEKLRFRRSPAALLPKGGKQVQAVNHILPDVQFDRPSPTPSRPIACTAQQNPSGKVFYYSLTPKKDTFSCAHPGVLCS